MLWREMGHAARRIWRAPLLFATIVTLMASGVAATASLFSVIDGVLFKPLPFPNPDRLIAVGSRRSVDAIRPGPMSRNDVDELQNRDLLPVAAFVRTAQLDTEDQVPGAGGVAAVSGLFFQVLGGRARLGRLLAEADAFAAPPVPIVFSQDEWQRQFGAREDIIGRAVDWRGSRFLAVGVAAAGFDFPSGAAAWVPLPPPRDARAREFAYLEVIGRLGGGDSVAVAAAKAPELVFQPLREYERPGGATGLMLLLLGTTLVLVVAWVQIAALQLSRADEIRHEIRIRLALGASWRHLVMHRTAEGVWLVTGALAVASVIVPAMTALVVTELPSRMTRGMPITTDTRVLAFGLFVSLLGISALVLVPVWDSRKVTALGVLRTARTFGSGTRARQALIAGQVAIAATVLYIAGLSGRSYAELRRVDLGFAVEDVVAVRLPPVDRENDRERTLQQRRAIVEAVRQLPGVDDVSAVDTLPFGGQTRSTLAVDGARKEGRLPVSLIVVEPHYFSTLAIPVEEGRVFTPADASGGALVAVVNRLAARTMRNHGRSVGAIVQLNGLPVRVVGVAGDTRDIHPAIAPEPRVYVPAAQWIAPKYLLARIASPSVSVMLNAQLRRLWPRDVAPPLVLSLKERLNHNLAEFRGRGRVLGLSAAVAMVLTLVGVWGLVTTATQRRAPEIAIRLVCGADPMGLSARVVGHAMWSVGVGLACGLALAALTTHLMSSLFFGVRSVDAVTTGMVTLAVLGIAVVSAAVPALRASRVEPWQVLRHDG